MNRPIENTLLRKKRKPKRAIVTVGLGFGDEGKGATVDFLARHCESELVVRYSGGAQAGHNVELPSGERHAFSQFGAGTFAGAKTWLGPRMIVSPETLAPEADHLKELGVEDPYSMLGIHPDALLATVIHSAMNRLREIDRGDAKHGSCGLGIGETRSYWLKHGLDSIVAADVHDRDVLISKLKVLRDRMLLEMQKLDSIDREFAQLIYRTSPAVEADIIIQSLAGVSQSRSMPDAGCVIFEGSQGVLLDEYFGFHPYTTWSTVTDHHAMELIEESGGFTDVVRLGLTRAYATRHGAGPFPTANANWTKAIFDAGNPHNGWQGSIQSGPLDLMLLRYALTVNEVDGIVVNNLDQLPATPSICNGYRGVKHLDVPMTLKEQSNLGEMLAHVEPVVEPSTQREILERIEELAPVVITSDGATFENRRVRGEIVAVPSGS